MADDDKYVGPPSGYGASGNLPPRASFFGAKSFTLVLLALATLSFLLLFIFNLLSLILLFDPITCASPLSGFVPGASELRNFRQALPHPLLICKRPRKPRHFSGDERRNRGQLLSSDLVCSGSFLQPACSKFAQPLTLRGLFDHLRIRPLGLDR